MTCDDQCTFDMGLNSSDPLTKTRMNYRSWNTVRRQFFRQYYDSKSAWVNLTAGQKYYIEGAHREGTGTDHFSVAVEIEKANSTGHNHAMKELQYLQAENFNASFEVTRLTVSDVVSTGSYKIGFQNPVNMSYTLSGSINTNATAA